MYSFLFWILSLGIFILRSMLLHVLIIYFFIVFHCTYINTICLSIQLMNIWLFLAIINTIAVNIVIILCVDIWIPFSWINSWKLNNWVYSTMYMYLINFLKKLPKYFLKTLYHFTFLQVVYQSPNASTPWPALGRVSLFNFSHWAGG